MVQLSSSERERCVDEWVPSGAARCPAIAWSDIAVIAGGLAALWIVRLLDASLFILASEMVFLIGVVAVFESARNLRSFAVDDYPLAVALSLLWVGLFRALHALADPTVGLLPGAGLVVQEEYELASSVLLAVGMLTAPFAIGRRIRVGVAVAAQALVSLVLVAIILWGGRGLAIGSDADPTVLASVVGACVVVALVSAMLLTARRRQLLTRPLFVGVESVLAVAVVTVGLETVFHKDLVTHLLWVALVALAYVAVTRNGLVRPTELMVEGLRRREQAAVQEKEKTRDQLQESEARYRTMFEDSPVAMWEEDHSLAMTRVRELVEAGGVTDLPAYLESHPEEYTECILLVRPRDVNREAVRLFAAKDRKELLARADEVYPPERRSNLCHFWAAYLDGGRSAEFDEVSVSLTGETLHLLERCSIAPGHEAFCDRVYVADMDVTARQRVERQLRTALTSTVAALESATELRDPYAAGHQRRVAELAVVIAHELGLDEATVETVRIAAQLHDIGKTVVPADILSLPRSLTAHEMDLVRTHCTAGADVVATVDFGSPKVAAVVAQHHERLDGSGYPAGLRGDAILLESRIVAVADVVDAMTSHRPYRPAHTLEEAIEELTSGAGSRYDAGVCAAARSVLSERVAAEQRTRQPSPS